MNNIVKVEDYKGLVRDIDSRAILSVDRQSLMEHRKNRGVMKNLIDNAKKIESLELDIQDIKRLLLQLTNKN